MKKYVKAEIIAKNGTTGSYAAGCPSHGTSQQHGSNPYCSSCERAF